MSDKIVACRRELGNIGEKKLCCKTIKTPTSLDWCDDCLARLPIWPIPEVDKEYVEYKLNLLKGDNQW